MLDPPSNSAFNLKMKTIIISSLVYICTLIAPNLALADQRVDTQCAITGCSAEICTNQFAKEEDGLATTCEYKDYYECYKLANCGFKKSTKQCGWEPNPQFTACLKAKKAPQTLIEKITGRQVVRFIIHLK